MGKGLDLTGIDLNELSPFDIHNGYMIRGRMEADVSGFKEGEIRPIVPETPFHLRDDWDGVLKNTPPRIGDMGINKDRQVFVCIKKDEWRYAYG